MQEVGSKSLAYDRSTEVALIPLVKENQAILLKSKDWAASKGLINSREVIYSGAQSFITPLNFPWKTQVIKITDKFVTFQYILWYQVEELTHALLASGIVNKVLKDNSNNKESRLIQTQNKEILTVLDLSHIVPMFLILLIGMMLSFVIFFMEIAIFVMTQRGSLTILKI